MNPSQMVDWQDPAFRRLVQEMVTQVVEDFVRTNELRAREFSLLERIVRVEEELKALREIEAARFEAMEKRFEAVDKRFEAIDKRFEAIDKRFESLERRLTFMQWFMGIGFTFIALLITLLNLS